MRRLSLLMAVVFLFALLSGCAAQASLPPTDDGKLSVVTTIFPPYDFVRELGGGKISVRMLLSPGEEVHTYEPTPQDIIAISECDLFIYTGGESDAWVEDVLGSIDNPDLTVLRMMDCVELYAEEAVEGMQSVSHSHDHDEESCTDHDHDHDTGHDAAEYDEHVWTSPVNAMAICTAIADALSARDSENKAFYASMLESYLAQLTALDADLRDAVGTGKRSTIVFSDRFPARYFAEEYGLSYFAAFPGCASQSEASARTVAFLIDKVRDEDIPVVFTVEFSNGKMADTICAETGAAALQFHSCHNVTKDEFESGVSYLSLMRLNAGNLRIALN